MKRYYAYVRVSTKEQELIEQQRLIETYAKKHGLVIDEWFEEKETAAERGRPIFARMLKQLQAGRASGVILHKIDRGSRNLREWVEINELNDAGVDVRLVHENLDLHTRSGRLSADIQAVIAADFIRNLRDEVRKGIEGRLHQGLLPGPAPLGYVNNGKGGKVKTLDPVSAPLIREAFELYATGQYTLNSLNTELYRRGLRNRVDGELSKTGLSKILTNEFYFGIIRIRRTGERYEGIHEALISKALFDQVQRLLQGKLRSRGWKHNFRYRQTLRCAWCERFLIGERQKGHCYYRCHAKACPSATLREEHIDREMLGRMAGLRLTPQQLALLEAHMHDKEEVREETRVETEAAFRVQLSATDERLNRLTDAYLDGVVDKEAFELRKAALFDERVRLREQVSDLQDNQQPRDEKRREKLELIRSLSLSPLPENPDEILFTLKSVGSNLRLNGTELAVDWFSPFHLLANRATDNYGVPSRATVRTAPAGDAAASDTAAPEYPKLGWMHEWCEKVWKGLCDA